MMETKNFDEYAAKLFGEDYSKKQFKSVGLCSGSDESEDHPAPFDVVVVDKNQNLISDDGKSVAEDDLPTSPLEEDSFLQLDDDHRSYGGRPHSRSARAFRKFSEASKEERAVLSKNEVHLNFSDDTQRYSKRSSATSDEGFVTLDDTDSEADLAQFCVDHMKLCKSRNDRYLHRKCRMDLRAGSRKSSDASSASSRSSRTGSRGSSISSLRPGGSAIYAETLEKLYNYAGAIIEDREALKQHLCQRKLDILEEQCEFMEEMVYGLLKMKKHFLARLEEFHDANIKHTTQQMIATYKLRQEIRLVEQSLELPSDFDDFVMYRNIVETAVTNTASIEDRLREVYNSTQYTYYVFCQNKDADRILDLDEIGEVKTLIETPNLPPFLSTSTPGEDDPPTEQTITSGLKFISCVEGENAEVPNCGFTGCAYASADDIVLADWNNGVIKMYNKLGVVADKLKFEESPWDLEQVNDGKIAVTVPKLKTVFFVECDTHLRTVHSFKTHCECFGICKASDNFVITCDPWSNSPSVRIFSEQGQELERFQYSSLGTALFQCPLYVCMDFFKTVMYVSDASADFVVALSMEGDIKFVYEHPDMHYATGVATDRNNWLYVCGKDSQTIHKISNRGELQEAIIKRNNEIRSPRALCVHPYGEYMVITDLEGEYSDGFLKKYLY